MRNGLCYLDENGVFCRDSKAPIYADVDCVSRNQLEVVRDRWLAMMNSGKLSESHVQVLQLFVDDCDFLIRGGRIVDEQDS